MIDYSYTRQAAIDRINSQPDPLVADLVALLDGLNKLADALAKDAKGWQTRAKVAEEKLRQAVNVCRLIVQAEENNKTGYSSDLTPDMILAARSAIEGIL